jgi:hypothetical protein
MLAEAEFNLAVDGPYRVFRAQRNGVTFKSDQANHFRQNVVDLPVQRRLGGAVHRG